MQKLGGGRLEGMAWADFGGVTQLPVAVEAGKSSWSLASALGCVLPRSWKLDGMAPAEESSPLGTHVTAPWRQRGAWCWGGGGRDNTQGPAALPPPWPPVSDKRVKRGCASSISQKKP